jgi:hypothetical protein
MITHDAETQDFGKIDLTQLPDQIHEIIFVLVFQHEPFQSGSGCPLSTLSTFLRHRFRNGGSYIFTNVLYYLPIIMYFDL